MTESDRERLERLARALEKANDEVAKTQTALEGAQARADLAEREKRDLTQERDRYRRSAAAADTLREDLAHARQQAEDAKHEAKVLRELKAPDPVDEAAIVAALREAYDAKEAELRAELKHARETMNRCDTAAREHALRAEAAERDLAQARVSIQELEAAADALAEVDVDEAAERTIRELRDQKETQARTIMSLRQEIEALQAASPPVDATAEPAPGVQARAEALALIAGKLGLRRNARPQDVLEAFETQAGAGNGEKPVWTVEAQRDGLLRVLAAIWPDRTPAILGDPLDCVDEATSAIAALKQRVEFAGVGNPQFRTRLFDALLARVADGSADPDVLDRLERLADGAAADV